MQWNSLADRIYPFQDEVLRVITGLETDFYLTGGTAASRAYLGHRFSDDLDLFVNDDPSFVLWADRVTAGLAGGRGWQMHVLLREKRFVRLEIGEAELAVKVEMVNDVPSHIGAVTRHPVLGRVDSAENILANKLTALADRDEPKDLADIWGFCCRMGLALDAALTSASSKAAGLFPPDLARRLLTATEADWRVIRWIDAPEPGVFLADLRGLGEQLLQLPPPG